MSPMQQGLSRVVAFTAGVALMIGAFLGLGGFGSAQPATATTACWLPWIQLQCITITLTQTEFETTVIPVTETATITNTQTSLTTLFATTAVTNTATQVTTQTDGTTVTNTETAVTTLTNGTIITNTQTDVVTELTSTTAVVTNFVTVNQTILWCQFLGTCFPN